MGILRDHNLILDCSVDENIPKATCFLMYRSIAQCGTNQVVAIRLS